MGLNVGLYLKESHVHSEKQNSLTHELETLLLTGLFFFDPKLASLSLNYLFTSRKIQNFPDYLRFLWRNYSEIRSGQQK